MTMETPRSTWLGIIPWLCIGAIGVAVYIALGETARPTTQVDFKVSRSEATEIAAAFLKAQGFAVDTYSEATVFQPGWASRTYLEKEFSPDEANRLIQDGVPAMNWYSRWFRQGELTDFRVQIAPDGSLNGFNRSIPDTAPGGRLSKDDALTLAMAFLDDQHISLDGWSSYQQSAEELSNRTDHVLIWQKDEFEGEPAHLRMYIDVQGDIVGGFGRFLDTPEAWERGQASDNAYRNLLQRLSGLPVTALNFAVVALMLVFMYTKRIRYGFGLTIAALVACVDVAANANELSTLWISYATNQPISGFWLSAIWNITISGLMTFFYVSVLALVTAVLCAELPATNPVLPGLVSLKRWATAPVLRVVLVGYGLMGVHLAYNALFYVVGRDAFGVWSPQPLPYSNLLSTPFPFLYPLTTGLSAAVQEEFLYRLIAIALFTRLFGIRSLAVVAAAMIWAFQHSNYPQDPFFIRGLELTVVGIAYGIVFLRYGLVATLLSHFGYNAIVSSEVLLTVDDPYLRFSGLFVLVILTAPLWPALYHVARHRHLAVLPLPVTTPPVQLMLRAPATVQTETLPIPPPSSLADIHRLLVFTAAALVVAVAAGAGLHALRSIPEEVTGTAPLSRLLHENERPTIAIERTREEIRQQAGAFLSDKGIDTAGWHSVVTFTNDNGNSEMDYLYQQVGESQYWDIVNTLFRQNATWYVRYFQPHLPEEYYVFLYPDGSPCTYWHVLPEDAPGASLSADEARAIAESALVNQYGYNLTDYTLADSNETARKNRRDHWFAYEWNGISDDIVSIRLSISVLGDEPVYASHSVEVPNTWGRARSSTGFYEYAAAIYGGAVAIFMGITLGALFVAAFLQGAVPWRLTAITAALMALGGLLITLNGIPSWWLSYNTSTDPLAYTTNGITKIANDALLSFIATWGGLALAWGAIRLFASPQQTLWSHFRTIGNTHWAEAIIRATAVLVFLAAGAAEITLLLALVSWATAPWQQITVFTPAPTPRVEGLDLGLIPGFGRAMQGILVSIITLNMLAFLWAMAAHYVRTPMRLLTIQLLLSVEGALAAASRPIVSQADFVAITAVSAVFLIGLFYVLRAVVGKRLHAALVTLLLIGILSALGASDLPNWVTLVVAVSLLLGMPAAAYGFLRWQGIVARVDDIPDHLSS